MMDSIKDTKYSFEIRWSDKDNAYISSVPEFKLFAHGSTPEEALAQAKVVLDIYIEDYKEAQDELPEPIKYGVKSKLMDARLVVDSVDKIMEAIGGPPAKAFLVNKIVKEDTV